MRSCWLQGRFADALAGCGGKGPHVGVKVTTDVGAVQGEHLTCRRVRSHMKGLCHLTWVMGHMKCSSSDSAKTVLGKPGGSCGAGRCFLRILRPHPGVTAASLSSSSPVEGCRDWRASASSQRAAAAAFGSGCCARGTLVCGGGGAAAVSVRLRRVHAQRRPPRPEDQALVRPLPQHCNAATGHDAALRCLLWVTPLPACPCVACEAREVVSGVFRQCVRAAVGEAGAGGAGSAGPTTAEMSNTAGPAAASAPLLVAAV